MTAQVIELPARRRRGAPARVVGLVAGWTLLLAVGVGVVVLVADPVGVAGAIVARYGALWVALGGVVLLGLALIRRPAPRHPGDRPLTLVRTEAPR